MYVGSSGSSGLCAPYPLRSGFIRGSAQECSAPSPIPKSPILWQLAAPLPRATASGLGRVGQRARPYYVSGTGPEGVWARLLGTRRGLPFRRAGVSHRPDVRARAGARVPRGVSLMRFSDSAMGAPLSVLGRAGTRGEW